LFIQNTLQKSTPHNSMSLTPPTGQPEAPVQECEALCPKEGCGSQLVRHAQLAHTGQLQVYTAQQGFPENQTGEGSEPKAKSELEVTSEARE